MILFIANSIFDNTFPRFNFKYITKTNSGSEGRGGQWRCVPSKNLFVYNFIYDTQWMMASRENNFRIWRLPKNCLYVVTSVCRLGNFSAWHRLTLQTLDWSDWSTCSLIRLIAVPLLLCYSVRMTEHAIYRSPIINDWRSTPCYWRFRKTYISL